MTNASLPIQLPLTSRPWIFTFALAFLAVVVWPFSFLDHDGPASYTIVVVCLSLAAVTAVWCAVAIRWWRFPIALVALAINGVILATATSPARAEIWVALIPLLVSLPIELTLETIRLFLGRFSNSGNINDFKEGLQFGILHLMGLTAVVAVLCSIGRYLVPILTESMDGHSYSILLMIASVLSVNTLTSTWALLGKRPVPRLFISLVSAGCVIALGTLLAPSGLSRVWMWIYSIVWLITTVQLALLRSQRVRFVQHAP